LSRKSFLVKTFSYRIRKML